MFALKLGRRGLMPSSLRNVPSAIVGRHPCLTERFPQHSDVHRFAR
jgi:hypothetical protein